MVDHTRTVRILICDDDPADRKLIRQLLKLVDGFRAELTEVDNGEDLIARLKDQDVDLVLLDVQLPGRSGLEWLLEIRALDKAPVLMVTGYGDEMIAVEAMKAGACDYLPKGQFSASSLSRSITNALDKWELERTIKQFRQELVMKATTDELTSTMNRRSLMDSIKQHFKAARSCAVPLTLVMIDIDHFKKVNDTYGHDVGDEVLVGVCRAIEKAVRPGDLLGRYGGEEFMLVMKGATLKEARQVAEACRDIVQETPMYSRDGHRVRCTISLGVAACTMDIASHEELIKRADKALYQAKKQGRNTVAVSDQAVKEPAA